MRGLTRVQDKYPTPELFEATLHAVVDNIEGPILPTTVAVELGVPEVSIRAMITDDSYGDAVEWLYVKALASVVEEIVSAEKGRGNGLMVLANDLFGWWAGCADFLTRSKEVEDSSDMVLTQLMEDVKGS